MRRLPFIAMLFVGACAQPPMTFPLPPAEPLDAHGVPPTFSACVRDKVRVYTQIYDLFYECQPRLVSYVGHLPLTQEEKAARLEELEKRGMDLSHEVAVARHGSRALPQIAPPPAPPPAPAEPGAYVIERQPMPRGELRF
jgi:hypothetical protein